MHKTYDSDERGEIWVVFNLGSDNPFGGIEVYAGRRGIVVEAGADGVSASGSGEFISWDELDQARQRATEMEEVSA